MYGLFGTDSTFGKGSLISIAKIVSKKYDNERTEALTKMVHILNQQYENNDWLVTLLCQYRDGDNISYYDGLWYQFIKKMICEGTLFMRLYTLNHWAYMDNQWDDNKKNIENIGIKLKKSSGNSDGIWQMDEPLELFKVYKTDKETPDSENIDRIILHKAHGIVEIGTTPICKTATQLVTNDILLRVPYKLEWSKEPVCAFFYNTKAPEIYKDL